MKKLFCLLSLMITTNLWAKNDIQMNLDVFHCGSEYKNIFEVEKKSGVYSADATGYEVVGDTFEKALVELKKELGSVSISRALILSEITSPNNPNVKFRKNIQIVRSSPASNIIQPPNCSVEAISSIKTSEEGYELVVNADIFEQLSVSGKIYTLFNLTLDLEQALFNVSEYEYGEQNTNLVQGREFLSCWYSRKCHPKSIAEFHQLAMNKNYNLNYLEQDGILFPFTIGGFENTIEFNKSTGLIEIGKSVLDSRYYFKKVRFFDSSFFFKKQYNFYSNNDSHYARFNLAGKVKCVPFLMNEMFSFPGLNNGEKFKLHDICWDDDYSITETSIITPRYPDKLLLHLKVNDDLVDMFDSSTIYFYKNGKINWVSLNKSTLHFNNQTLSIDGSFKLFPSGKPQCFQVNKAVSMKLPNGTTLKIPINTKSGFNRSDIFCFSEDGNFVKSFDSYYYAIVKEFP